MIVLTPEQYHRANHTRCTDIGDADFTDCWRCQRARAHCRSKLRFDSYEAADQAIRAKNEGDGYRRPVVRYLCRWCNGWHMTTARGKHHVRRAEKQRRKWLIREATFDAYLEVSNEIR